VIKINPGHRLGCIFNHHPLNVIDTTKPEPRGDFPWSVYPLAILSGYSLVIKIDLGARLGCIFGHHSLTVIYTTKPVPRGDFPWSVYPLAIFSGYSRRFSPSFCAHLVRCGSALHNWERRALTMDVKLPRGEVGSSIYRMLKFSIFVLSSPPVGYSSTRHWNSVAPYLNLPPVVSLILTHLTLHSGDSWHANIVQIRLVSIISRITCG
jgi:hypothetical protein